MFNRLLVAALAVSLPCSTSAAVLKRHAADLDRTYDFVIAGGGTAGLTIADRVSAAFPNRSVLVVEVGNWDPRPPWYEPDSVTWDMGGAFVYSQPIPTLNNRTPRPFMVGKTLGGSSAINGQVFDRASRHDYDMWSSYAGADGWDWEGLKPYFQKSVTFVEPTVEEIEQYGYTWDIEAAYGGSTPVNSSFPPFQWPTTGEHHRIFMKGVMGMLTDIRSGISRQAWQEVGLEVKKECAGGDKAGLCWVSTSQTPWDASRSHAGIGHYELIKSRPNLHVITNHKVLRVVYSGDDLADQVPVVEIKSLNDSSVYNVSAKAEVIISAGTVHTPQVLQRSGLGPAALLKNAGIDVVLELPGVGYNFQDHTAAQFAVNVTKDLLPNENELSSNKTFLQDSLAQYALRPARGPYTQGVANTAAFPALNVITDEYKALAAAVRGQIANGSAAQYLPPGTPETVVTGYYKQLAYIADAMENTNQPFMEGWTSGVPQYGTLLHPLSRGSILLNTSDIDGEPIINFNTASNPLDLDIIATFVPFFRKLWATDAFRDLGIVETSPGASVTDTEDLKRWLVDEALQQSDYHPCCTANMAALEDGGVVGADLRVHGLRRLRVADLSVAPLELGTHTQSTAYAIGEKAADLIIADWS